jgi:uncharacterized protein YidB (DUF937 family)
VGLLDEIFAQQSQSGASPRTGGDAAGGPGANALAVALQELLRNCTCEQAGSGAAATPSRPPMADPSGASNLTPGQTPGQDPGADLVAGLNSLLQKLHDAGLDQVIKTWIGNGENAPVAPRDLGSALGADSVRKAADQAGIEQNDLLTQLAKALPQFIDELTPSGNMPGSRQQISDMMRKR